MKALLSVIFWKLGVVCHILKIGGRENCLQIDIKLEQHYLKSKNFTMKGTMWVPITLVYKFVIQNLRLSLIVWLLTMPVKSHTCPIYMNWVGSSPKKSLQASWVRLTQAKCANVLLSLSFSHVIRPNLSRSRTPIMGSLSTRVFETRTATGREHSVCQDSGVSHIFNTNHP